MNHIFSLVIRVFFLVVLMVTGVFNLHGLAEEAAALPVKSDVLPGIIPEQSFYVGIQKVTPEGLYGVLPELRGKAVFLEFKSKFCLACKQMDPIIEEILPDYPNVEVRMYDMMKDRKPHANIFALYQPSVVPILLYINQKGETVNVFYDFHPEEELRAAMSCIDPTRDLSGCQTLASKQSDESSLLHQIDTLFVENVEAGSVFSVILAFMAGVLSSFFPCTVAMLPLLVGYVGGYSQEGSKLDLLAQVGLFILGLATVMTVLGLILSFIGKSFGEHNSTLLYIAIGLLCIFMALQLMEIVQIPLPQVVKQLPETKEGNLLTFYVLGCAFGLVASPCGTPVLAVILGLIAKEGNLLLGGISLFAYALGQGMLLLIAGFFTGLLKYRSNIMQAGSLLTKISGILIILVGIGFILHGTGIWTWTQILGE